MLRKFAELQHRFVQAYGATMTVRDYYQAKRGVVELRNLERDAPLAARVFERVLSPQTASLDDCGK